MARLAMPSAPTAAPTPALATKIEAWDAKANPQTPAIIVPVAPPKGPDLRGWLSRWWPTLKPEQIPLADYVVKLDAQGIDPLEPPSAIQPWAHFAARGYFELDWSSRRGTSGGAVGRLAGWWAGPPTGPIDQYSALVVQARGPSDPNAKAAVMAFVNYHCPADSFTVFDVLRDPDWHERIGAMAR